MVIVLSIVRVYILLSLLFGKVFVEDLPYFDLVARQCSGSKIKNIPSCVMVRDVMILGLESTTPE